jgi:CubicO group peptidase (beta-lactamase class C family)
MKFFSSFLVVFLLFIYPTFSQDKFQEIDQFLEQEMQTWKIPNIALAITNKDSILYIKEYGKDNSKGNYLIGSVAKSFTAISVMQLVEKGKLELDKPVKTYLEWFELTDKSLSNKITVRHLLQHTSGLPKNAGFFTPTSTVQNEIEQAYQEYLLGLEINADFIGKTHVYCNLNYEILGQLIEKVSGLKYAEYVTKFIFQPLKMNNSFARETDIKTIGLKNGYQYIFGFPIQKTVKYNDNGTAAGNIASNPKDMAFFLQMLLNKGRFGSDTLLQQQTLDSMHVPFSKRYGMGFSIGKWNGLHSIRHTGLSANYSSAINILPDQNYGIVILTNINGFTEIHNLMDGVIIRLNNQEKIEYRPDEMYFRYFLLALSLWHIFDFVRKLIHWKKLGFATKFVNNKKWILTGLFGIFISSIWLIIIPIYMETPLSAMPILQPDLGYTLIFGSILGVVNTVIHYFIKTSQSNT